MKNRSGTGLWGPLHYNLGVSIAHLKERAKLWNISREENVLRHASILKVWSKRGNMDSENTYIPLCYRIKAVYSRPWQRRRGSPAKKAPGLYW